jgi:hypothetical protein
MEAFSGSMAVIKSGNPEDAKFHAGLFEKQVQLWMDMATMEKRKPTKAMKNRQAYLRKKFSLLSKVLSKEILGFAKNQGDRNHRIVQITVFMHLLDIMKRIDLAVKKENKKGISRIHICTASQAMVFMSADFFLRPYNTIIRQYLHLEPAITACARLSNVPMISIQSAVAEKEPELLEKIQKKPKKKNEKRKKK